MSNLIEKAKLNVDSLIGEACDRAAKAGLFPEGARLHGTVEIPKDAANGDYAANHAMAGAKAMRMAPRKIAEILLANIELEGSYFRSVEIAGPGFMNFRLSEKWYAQVLSEIESEGADFGRSDAGKGEKVMVEFVSANPTGPMHMGNARGGVLGDSLANVLNWAGCDTWKEFYVNDAGNQINKFATSIHARYMQLVLGEDGFEFPEDGYHGDDIREMAKGIFEKYGDSLKDAEQAEWEPLMSAFGLERNIPRMQSDLRKYGIEYDL